MFYFQTQLLDDHIRELKRVLKPGHKRLNWNSLGISDYITRCDQVKANFSFPIAVSQDPKIERNERKAYDIIVKQFYASACAKF